MSTPTYTPPPLPDGNPDGGADEPAIDKQLDVAPPSGEGAVSARRRGAKSNARRASETTSEADGAGNPEGGGRKSRFAPHWIMRKSNDYIMTLPWGAGDQGRVERLLYTRTAVTVATVFAVLYALSQAADVAKIVGAKCDEGPTADDDFSEPSCNRHRRTLAHAVLAATVAAFLGGVWRGLNLRLKARFLARFGNVGQDSLSLIAPSADSTETAVLLETA